MDVLSQGRQKVTLEDEARVMKTKVFTQKSNFSHLIFHFRIVFLEYYLIIDMSKDSFILFTVKFISY